MALIMNAAIRKWFLVLAAIIFFQQGYSVSVHENNKEIFAAVIQEYLNAGNDGFFSDIDVIGQKALERGLDLSGYWYNQEKMYYKTYLLWEGKERSNVVFLLYVWPPKSLADMHGVQSGYCTYIHSHPIPCALYVLSNAITERYYKRRNAHDRSILYCGSQVLQKGEKSVDLRATSFIHQLLFVGDDKSCAITLHAYGAPSLEELDRIFTENSKENRYCEQ